MLYYTHNVVGAVNLIEACRKHNLKNVSLAVLRSSDAIILLVAFYMSVTNSWSCSKHTDNVMFFGVQLVFSSSCTVYGNPKYTPLDEKHRLQVTFGLRSHFSHSPSELAACVKLVYIRI